MKSLREFKCGWIIHNVDIKKGKNSHLFGEIPIKASPPIYIDITFIFKYIYVIKKIRAGLLQTEANLAGRLMHQNKFIDVTLALDNEEFIVTHKDASCIYIRAHNNKEGMQ